MKAKIVIHRIMNFIIGFLLLLVIVIFGYDMYLKTFFSKPLQLDKEGKLYYVEYQKDYNSPLVTLPVKLIKPVKNAGCSCFSAGNGEKQFLTARNYDLAHLDSDGNPTGLNVVLKCTPEGKYQSLNVADAAWISSVGIPYYAESLSNGKVDQVFLALLPYMCMDGINEKGLSVSILSLDIKEGESPVYQTQEGREGVLITVLMRKLLDECASVEEAVQLAESYNVVNTLGNDFHLFVTDASGASAVFEWRFDEFVVTETDIVTNFYVAFDDAEDCYWNGQLKERFLPPESNEAGYRFGYGHGYERFKVMMKKKKSMKEESAWTEEEIKETLRGVAQEYTGELTSLTQYSAIYDHAVPGLTLWVYPDYENVYRFDLR